MSANCSKYRTKDKLWDKRGHVIVEGVLVLAGFLLFIFLYLLICKEGARAINHFRIQANEERRRVDGALQKITNKKMVDAFTFDRIFPHHSSPGGHER